MLFNHYLQYNLFISAKNVLGNIIYYVCFFYFYTDYHDLFAVSRLGGMEMEITRYPHLTGFSTSRCILERLWMKCLDWVSN